MGDHKQGCVKHAHAPSTSLIWSTRSCLWQRAIIKLNSAEVNALYAFTRLRTGPKCSQWIIMLSPARATQSTATAAPYTCPPPRQVPSNQYGDSQGKPQRVAVCPLYPVTSTMQPPARFIIIISVETLSTHAVAGSCTIMSHGQSQTCSLRTFAPADPNYSSPGKTTVSQQPFQILFSKWHNYFGLWLHLTAHTSNSFFYIWADLGFHKTADWKE